MAEDRGERQTNRILHQHVDEEEPEVVAKRVPERPRPARIAEEGAEVLEPGEDRSGLAVRVKRQPQGVEKRPDHHRRIDEDGRRQKHRDMKPWPDCHLHVPRSQWWKYLRGVRGADGPPPGSPAPAGETLTSPSAARTTRRGRPAGAWPRPRASRCP